jgi:hypothetical protein
VPSSSASSRPNFAEFEFYRVTRYLTLRCKVSAQSAPYFSTSAFVDPFPSKISSFVICLLHSRITLARVSANSKLASICLIQYARAFGLVDSHRSDDEFSSKRRKREDGEDPEPVAQTGIAATNGMPLTSVALHAVPQPQGLQIATPASTSSLATSLETGPIGFDPSRLPPASTDFGAPPTMLKPQQNGAPGLQAQQPVAGAQIPGSSTAMQAADAGGVSLMIATPDMIHFRTRQDILNPAWSLLDFLYKATSRFRLETTRNDSSPIASASALQSVPCSGSKALHLDMRTIL